MLLISFNMEYRTVVRGTAIAAIILLKLSVEIHLEVAEISGVLLDIQTKRNQYIKRIG